MDTFFGKRVILVVTGASRGLGREISKQFSSKLAEGSVVILTARSALKLEDLRAELSAKNSQILIETLVSDAATATCEEYEKMFAEKLHIEPEAVVVVHNVGTIGKLDESLAETRDASYVDQFMQLNVRHPILLSTVAIAKGKTSTGSIKTYLINISSLASSQPIGGVGLYCTAKAGRRMYFNCLAAENPSVKILQYSPGPLETDMMSEVQASENKLVKEFAANLRNMVKLEDTVAKLASILEKGEYTSGAHIDYFD